MTEPLLRYKDVCKQFGSKIAVANLNLEVQRGELFGLIGPNGAGKTTSIKMAVGILEATSGVITIDGVDVREGRARKLVGYVADQAPMYDKLTGNEMLALTANLFGVKKKDYNERVGVLTHTFDLQGVMNEMIQAYSRGMRQKLALCCALVHNPEIIFLDEPTVGLDPAGMVQLKRVLQGLAREGRAVFISTHALNVAEEICDQIGIFSQGQLLMTGSVEELNQGAGKGGLEEMFLSITKTTVQEGDLLEVLRK